ncbi:hypothetical protein ABIE18_001874 [Arthrobacter sp. 2762]
MQVVVIAVSREAQTNLAVGLEENVWGFTRSGPAAVAIQAGIPVLLGTNFTHPNGRGNPRISYEEYKTGRLGVLILARATGRVRTVPDVELFPDEIAANNVLYRERFPLSPLATASNVEFADYPAVLSEAFHRSINSVGSPVAIDLPESVLDQMAKGAGLDQWPLLESQFGESTFELDADDLLPATTRRRGAGRESDPIVRMAIEKHAVSVAMQHYRTAGWSVEERGKPFDILCTRDHHELRVEVKGTRSLAATVELTINEVRSAHEHPSELFIVRNIQVEWNAAQEPVASGGDARIFDAWQPSKEALRPIRFTYEVPWE